MFPRTHQSAGGARDSYDGGRRCGAAEEKTPNKEDRKKTGRAGKDKIARRRRHSASKKDCRKAQAHNETRQKKKNRARKDEALEKENENENEKLREDRAPVLTPFSAGPLRMRCVYSALTGKPYTEGNAAVLNYAMVMSGLHDPAFMTLARWNKLGGRIVRGAKGVRIVMCAPHGADAAGPVDIFRPAMGWSSAVVVSAET